MAAAKLRRITLPDALPSSTRKPGPSERKLTSYRELSEALASKELISQWHAHSPGSRSDLQLREALNRTLSEHAFFGYIRSSSKLPRSHPGPKAKISFHTASGAEEFSKPNGTEWLGSPTPPSRGNWSVIPKLGGRLMIFDLDVAKLRLSAFGEPLETSADERYLEARRSIAQLQELLGMDLRRTYAQLSPSGGVHIFLLLPEGVDPQDLPSAKISDGMRSLVGIAPDRWGSELRGDIRSGASNGFLLMAGSRISREDEDSFYYMPLVADPRWSDFKDFRSGRKLRILELTEAAVDRLKEARALDLSLRGSSQSTLALGDGSIPLGPSFPAIRGELSDELQSRSYGRLLQRLREQPPSRYHEARAQIYRALSCCSSPEAIAELCRISGYDRDSARNRVLSQEELLADLESMDRRGLTALRCGPHCRVQNSAEAEEPSSRALELETLLSAVVRENPELSPEGLKRLQSEVLIGGRARLDLRDQRRGSYGIYGKRRPRALSYGAVARAILGERSYAARLRDSSAQIAAYRLRALELMVGYFGPLFSAGAEVAIAPAGELMELFGYSRSQLREALRLLRELEILTVRHRQSSGRSATYGAGDAKFYDRELGRSLLRSWAQSRIAAPAGAAFLGGYFDYSRGRVVRPDGTSFSDRYLREVGGGFSGLLLELSIDLPRSSRVAHSVVGRYLGKALDHYRAAAESAEEMRSAIESAASAEPEAFEPRPRSTPSPILFWRVRIESCYPRKDSATGRALRALTSRVGPLPRAPPG